MARIEHLASEIPDAKLRAEIEEEIRLLKERVTFGLVFERHLPECAVLAVNRQTAPGDEVQLRTKPKDRHRYRIEALTGNTATISDGRGSSIEAELDDLVLVKNFGEPIYPTVRSLGKVGRAAGAAPHLAIQGENYHALQLLSFCYAGQVDCIYIDPPYNTGARDWKYNNDYVDKHDSFRHSKWLSYMERRLNLAKKLLKPDGVLIITIDDNELHHLGVLLETLFPSARRQVVSIVINPAGASGDDGGLSRVEEYAIFVFLGDAEPSMTDDDMLVVDASADVVHTNAQGVRWEWLMRGGNAWYREARKNLCYPIILDEDGIRIIEVGDPLEGPESKRSMKIQGLPVAWPVRKDGKLGIWRVDAARLKWLVKKGYAYVSQRDEERGTWTIKYLMGGTVAAIEGGAIEVVGFGDRGQVNVKVSERKKKTAKTVWYRGRHTAGGGGGTAMLSAFLGKRDVFSFPKSLYSTRDCLEVAIGDRREALILDFFAGSGTTLHATLLMNATDGGNRRCIAVTNNEVGETKSKKLNKAGHFLGDSEFEEHGVYESALQPRITAAVEGVRADGTPVPGNYLDGRAFAEGFEANVEFLAIDYLNPDQVEIGLGLEKLHPVLWLLAGASSWRSDSLDVSAPFFVEADSGYAVLLDEARFADLLNEIKEQKRIRHVFLVTDYEDAYSDMASELGPGRIAHLVPRDYLRAF